MSKNSGRNFLKMVSGIDLSKADAYKQMREKAAQAALESEQNRTIKNNTTMNNDSFDQEKKDFTLMGGMTGNNGVSGGSNKNTNSGLIVGPRRLSNPEEYKIATNDAQYQNFQRDLRYNSEQYSKKNQRPQPIIIPAMTAYAPTPERKKTYQELMAEIDALIGLEGVKEELKKMANFMRVTFERRRRGLSGELPNMHMMFTGNPGTGKTTIAQYIALIYKEIGLLKKGHTVHIESGTQLQGEHLGTTVKKVTEIVESAVGGVLFIDEAHSMYNGVHDQYGREAINTLVPLMENRRHELVVILAGYTDQTQKLYEINPGLKQRIGYTIRLVATLVIKQLVEF